MDGNTDVRAEAAEISQVQGRHWIRSRRYCRQAFRAMIDADRENEHGAGRAFRRGCNAREEKQEDRDAAFPSKVVCRIFRDFYDNLMSSRSASRRWRRKRTAVSKAMRPPWPTGEPRDYSIANYQPDVEVGFAKETVNARGSRRSDSAK